MAPTYISGLLKRSRLYHSADLHSRMKLSLLFCPAGLGFIGFAGAVRLRLEGRHRPSLGYERRALAGPTLLDNTGNTAYFTNISLGSPPTTVSVNIDTGRYVNRLFTAYKHSVYTCHYQLRPVGRCEHLRKYEHHGCRDCYLCLRGSERYGPDTKDPSCLTD